MWTTLTSFLQYFFFHRMKSFNGFFKFIATMKTAITAIIHNKNNFIFKESFIFLSILVIFVRSCSDFQKCRETE